MDSDFLLKSAAFLGSTGVGAGAFGAHSLKNVLQQKPNGLDNWKTAVMYQLIQATTLLALSAVSKAASSHDKSDATKSTSLSSQHYDKCGKIIAAGTVMFSGSIYGLVLDKGPKKILGPMTPIGGLFMMIGWAMIGFAP